MEGRTAQHQIREHMLLENKPQTDKCNGIECMRDVIRLHGAEIWGGGLSSSSWNENTKIQKKFLHMDRG